MWPKRNPVNQVPAHWSKDFVEHLRTVHFALLAISAGLILLVLSARKFDPVKALVQVEEMMDLKDQWSVQWITKHGDKSEPYVRKEAPIVTLASGEKVVAVPFIFDEPKIMPMHGRVVYRNKQELFKWRVNRDWLTTDDNWSPEAFPRTLLEFRQWWGVFEKPREIVVPASITGDAIPLDPNDRRFGHLELIHFLIPGEREATEEGAELSPYRDTEGNLNYMFAWKRLRMDVPIYSANRYFISQNTLLRTFKVKSSGNFEYSFADLWNASRDFEELPLADIREFLHDQAAKGQEVFEFAGMKFPAGSVTLWGELLLLSVQLYFFIYLRQLSGKLRADDPGWDVPWVGMDTFRLSQIILLVSLVFLPVAAMGLLGGQAFLVWGKTALPDDSWHRLLHRSEPFALGIAVIASICLRILSWRYRPKVEAEEPSYSSPLFY